MRQIIQRNEYTKVTHGIYMPLIVSSACDGGLPFVSVAVWNYMQECFPHSNACSSCHWNVNLLGHIIKGKMMFGTLDFYEMGHSILRWKRSWRWTSFCPYFTKHCLELPFYEQQNQLSRLQPRTDTTWFSCHTTNLRRLRGGRCHWHIRGR